ncbi:MAG: hypothetical protein ACUVUS_06100 [Thermoproteota archaeon]
MSEGKHKIRVLERDVDRRYIILKLDGEKVRVERFTEEDEEWSEHLRSGKFNICQYESVT